MADGRLSSRAASLLGAVLAVAGLALGCGNPPPEAPRPTEVSVAPPPPATQLPPEPPRPRGLRIGVILSMTGEDAVFGHETLPGIQLALAQAGGRGGAPFDVVVADDKSRANDAAEAALALAQGGAVAIVGDVASSRTLAAAIVANKKGIPLLTPASTHPDVVKVGPFVFRACLDDEQQAKAAARYLVDRLKKKRIGVLFAADDLYSSGVAKAFADEAKRLGVTLVAQRSFLKQETDFASHLRELKAARPEVVFAPVYYNAMAVIARAAKTAGLPASAFFGSDGWSADELVRDAAGAVDGAAFTDHWVLDLPTKTSKGFVDDYRARYGKDPTALSAMGFEAGLVLADAVGRAKEPTPAALGEALAATRNVVGLAGPISFDADRVTKKPVVVVEIKGGKFAFKDLLLL